MGHILKKDKGSSMLLAICIFLILTVLGINVLAASYSNVQNMKSKYETEQTMQYVNSIYGIVDEQIRDGKFELGSFLSGAGTDSITTDKSTIINGHSEDVVTYIEFSRDNALNIKKRLKAKVFVEYKNWVYCVTSTYIAEIEDTAGTGDTYKYTFESCEGVTSSEKL